MSALLAVLVLTAAISMVMVVLGVLADWAWPWLERFGRSERRQATRRPSGFDNGNVTHGDVTHGNVTHGTAPQSKAVQGN